jgi:small subunit ribosomal protein S17e
VAAIPSKPMRNKVAGYVTHLMRRLEKGPVRGISFRLQEEEREKRDNWMPTTSKLDQPIAIDEDTMDMLEAISMPIPEGVTVRERRPRK